MASPLAPYIIENYAKVKQLYPGEGRRKWRLRIAHQFWAAVRSGGSHPGHDAFTEATSVAESTTDPDPLDGVTRDEPELGLIVRTDFSDEPAWLAFCARLQESEKDLILGSDDTDAPQPNDTDEDEDSDDEVEGPPSILRVVNPTSPQERELLTYASNLSVLRMFNDVDVRPSPSPPPGTKRINPPNRLVDHHGWQEFYRGKNVWIYDTQSNTDQCVRVVSQSGDMYGTATGDSWRARASHICELQVNLSTGAVKIDFGGLDRWDFNERKRNTIEAEAV